MKVRIRARWAVAGLLLFLFSPAQKGIAQPPPIEWGKISPDVLSLRDYPPDSSATAVILAEYSTIEFDAQFRPVLDRHRRIKILKPSAYDTWGTVTLAGYADVSDISKVEGQTFNLDARGRIETIRVDKKSIFSQKSSAGYREIRFTLPALQPGSVIEYRYRVTYEHPIYLPTWTIQYAEPTLFSEFRMEIPEVINFAFIIQGHPLFEVDESIPYTRFREKGVIHRWVIRDVPSLRDEPFITTAADYAASVRFQIHSVRVNGRYEPFVGDWSELAETLMDSPSFGGQIGGDRELRRQAESVVAGLDDVSETARMKALYDHVRASMSWNGGRGYFPSEKLGASWKNLSADVAGMNLTLIALLREAGLEASPVLLSTRDNGRITQRYPLLQQFDYLITHVEADGESYLLDPTDRGRPMNLLPFRALSGIGWLVECDGAHRWIKVGTEERFDQTATIIGRLDPSGAVAGTLHASFAGYGALEARALLDEADDERAIVRSLVLGDQPDAEIDTTLIRNREDIESALVVELAFRAPQAGQSAGDMLFLNPTLVGRMEENPLRAETRAFPVDFGYPSRSVYSLVLALPEGYSVVEGPTNRKLKLRDGSATLTRFVEQSDSVFTLRTVVERQRSVYEPSDYAELRAFYERVVATDAEQIVLKRSAVALKP